MYEPTSGLSRTSGRSRSDQPFITIAIPTYNRAQLVKTCVISALAQSYDHFEVLVSDNASTDETQEILAQFHDPRLRVLRHDANIGLLPNWNACLSHARGEYVVLVSDDDTVSPWLLERCAAMTANYPQLPIVVALSNLHSASLARIRAARTCRYLGTGIHDGTDILLAYLRYDIDVVATCSMMLRTETVRAVGGFPLHLPHSADVGAWARLLFIGKAGFVNEACATWFSHGASETARLGAERRLRDLWMMVDLISDQADRHTRDPSLRRRIQVEARRGFANRGLIVLSDHRRRGGRLTDIFGLLWRDRRYLRHAQATSVLKFGAINLCPRRIARHIRQVRWTVMNSIESWKLGRTPSRRAAGNA